ncbi:hypothetical protein [Levyella massiliensis]|uniref:hypothetical protein n=1 Tax=Levyella massiliensis TaxID=938289 RepID=UPI0023F526AE|nr:hypothetical protein [Levyella massiliensis]
MVEESVETLTIFQNLLEKYEDLWRKLKPSPKIKGHLEIDHRRNPPEYYHCWYDKETNRRVRRYLDKSQFDLARRLAQQSYDQRISRLICKRLRQLLPLCRDFSDEEIDATYEMMDVSKQPLVQHITRTKREKLEDWLAKPYTPLNFAQGATFYRTKNGETVRSKSEKILADLFYDNHIVYKYECPLQVGALIFHPDFTFFDAIHDEELYWEHLGMMGNPDYQNRAHQKIRYYQKHNFIVGKNLIVSAETEALPLDIEEVETLVREHLRYCAID